MFNDAFADLRNLQQHNELLLNHIRLYRAPETFHAATDIGRF